MKYAVVQTGGKQYKVMESSIIEIDKIDAKNTGSFNFDKVLLYASDEAVHIGTPNLNNVIVSAKIIGQIKGKKIRVAKFKAKARVRSITGHRQHLTKVQIDKISTKNTAKAVSTDKAEIKTIENKAKKPKQAS